MGYAPTTSMTLTNTVYCETCDSTSTSSDGLSTGAIVGIAVGGAVLLVALIGVALWCSKRQPAGTVVSNTHEPQSPEHTKVDIGGGKHVDQMPGLDMGKRAAPA
eukprot:TRINITY_DN32994_c0_g1_i1.p3 TRINITY_DN32994_c0_g1~~TRINITY_DN32994_c0_g1_i1.p3  ORF type:complete len:104 (-),score=28.70 TRINITY_DN32994_c0_g1_i1:4-315(-)